MAYSYQTYTFGSVATAAKLQQTEDNIRDHVHGTSSGVSNILGEVGIGVAPYTTWWSEAHMDVGSDGAIGNNYLGELSLYKNCLTASGGVVLHKGGMPAAKLRLTVYGGLIFETSPTQAAGSPASLSTIFSVTPSGMTYQKRGCLVSIGTASAYVVSAGLTFVKFAPGAAIYDTDGVFQTNSWYLFQVPADVSKISATINVQGTFANNEGGSLTFGAYGTTVVVNSTAYSRLGATGGQYFSFKTSDFTVTSGQQLALYSNMLNAWSLNLIQVQVDIIA